MIIKNNLHKKGFALGLVLKQRHAGLRPSIKLSKLTTAFCSITWVGIKSAYEPSGPIPVSVA